LRLEFERDAENPHDRNAIRVIGCYKGLSGTKRNWVGYVPAAVARKIVDGGYWGRVKPRLLKTYLGEGGPVEILFQLLGPEGERYSYEHAAPAIPPVTELGKTAHFTDFISQVTYLKHEKKYKEAIDLLLKLVAATEEEAQKQGCGVAPWYYEQLAIIYRKEKMLNDEVAILERYSRQPKAPGAGPSKLAERLEKASLLRDRNRV